MNRNHSHKHLTDRELQAFLEGDLSSREAPGVEARLEACAGCRAELESWKLLFQELAELPELAPSAAFADGVMARVQIPAVTPVEAPAQVPETRSAGARLLRWIRDLAPARRHPWAVASGVALAPMAAGAAVCYWLLTRPYMTVGALADYAGREVFQTGRSVVQRLFGGVTESTILFRFYQLVESMAAAPGSAAITSVLFTVVAAAAAWILYRNLFGRPTTDRETYAYF